MDIAVNLVESYLRLNGYLTLSEFEIQARNERGIFESVTDVDIMAIRFPGDVFVSDPHDGVEARMLAIEDPALLLEPDQIDVIIGEVKQGNAQFNPGLRRHLVLHSMLRRVEWMFVDDLNRIVDQLATAQPVHGPRAQRGDDPGAPRGLRALGLQRSQHARPRSHRHHDARFSVGS